MFHLLHSFSTLANEKLRKIPAFNIWMLLNAAFESHRGWWKNMNSEACNSDKVQLIEKHSGTGSWRVTRYCRLRAKSHGRMNGAKVYSLILGLCTIKGTTGVVCYVSNCILDAFHSHGPQFQTGPDLSSKVSPSEPESYADLNTWIRMKIQLRFKDDQLITQNVLLCSCVCPALVRRFC